MDKLEFDKLKTKIDKICIEFGLKKIERPEFQVIFYCIDENNPIWDNTKMCPSAIVYIDSQYKFIQFYNEIHPVPGNKVYLDGEKSATHLNTVYYYKNIIKQTIIDYKQFLLDLKLSKLEKDF